jgi:hypothetical protein
VEAVAVSLLLQPEALEALVALPQEVEAVVRVTPEQAEQAALVALVTPASLLSKETQCATQSLKTVWW